MGNGASSSQGEAFPSNKSKVQPAENGNSDTRPPEPTQDVLPVPDAPRESKGSVRGLLNRVTSSRSGKDKNKVKPMPSNGDLSTSKTSIRDSQVPDTVPEHPQQEQLQQNGAPGNGFGSSPKKVAPEPQQQQRPQPPPQQPSSSGEAQDRANVPARRGQIYEKGINPQQKKMAPVNRGQSTRGMSREEFKNLVVGGLRNFFFMGDEVFERMDLVLDSMRDEVVEAGEYLMRQGEEGSKMYVIQSGTMEITIDGNLIRMLSAGDAVGELALLYNAPRSASVRAAEPCVVWSLARETFREVQALASSVQLLQRVAWLLDVPTLRRLDKLDLCKLASSLRTAPLRHGEVLVTEGQATDRCFLLENGVVRGTSSSLGTKEQLEAAAEVVHPTAETALTVQMGENKSKKEKGGRGSGQGSPMPNMPTTPRRHASIGSRQSLSMSMTMPGEISAGAAPCVEFTEGCFLGTPTLLTAAGEPGHWAPQAESGRLTGVVPPLTYVARGECRVSYITLKDFEGIVGALREKLGGGADGAAPGPGGLRRQESDTNLVSSANSYKVDDFQELAVLGTGSFGRVSLARYSRASEGAAGAGAAGAAAAAGAGAGGEAAAPKVVALKAVSKVGVIEGGQLAHLHDERRLLLKLRHPFVMRLWGTFQDRDNVYFVTEALNGGELWSVIYEGLSGQAMYGLPAAHARFYAATVIEALSFMHYKGVAYRDLKPENIMVDNEGYTRIIDLGFAKKIPFIEEGKDGRIEVYPKSYTMCGTPEYLAPEFIFNKGHDVSADYWAFGVLVFELLAGHTPFVPPEGYSNITELFTSIATSKRQGIPFPEDFNAKAGGREARDLVIKLLQAEPSHRLGNLAGRADDIKNHAFFKSHIDFQRLVKKEIAAPWVPTTHFPQSQGAEEAAKQEQPIYFGKQELFEGF